MTTIYTKIKTDFVAARKDRNSSLVTLLSTVIGEMDNEASRAKDSDKTVSDAVATKILKSFSKNLEELIIAKGNNPDDISERLEKTIIDSYIPTQLDEDGLRSVIAASGVTGIKDVMTFLKANHAGLYDGKLASTIAKEFA